MPLDLDSLAAAAAPAEIPEKVTNREGKPNPFVPLIQSLNAARGTASAVPLAADTDDKTRETVMRTIREAAAAEGVSARIKWEKDNARLVVWVIDRVTRAPRKAKADADSSAETAAAAVLAGDDVPTGK